VPEPADVAVFERDGAGKDCSGGGREAIGYGKRKKLICRRRSQIAADKRYFSEKMKAESVNFRPVPTSFRGALSRKS
jgi:hypothetical protein